MRYLQRREILAVLIQHIQVLYDDTEPDGTFNCKLGGLDEAASALIELESSKQPRGTGCWVMVRRVSENEWLPVGCVSEDDETFYEHWYPQFDQIIPIANPEDVPEFGGF